MLILSLSGTNLSYELNVFIVIVNHVGSCQADLRDTVTSDLDRGREGGERGRDNTDKPTDDYLLRPAYHKDHSHFALTPMILCHIKSLFSPTNNDSLIASINIYLLSFVPGLSREKGAKPLEDSSTKHHMIVM